MLKMNYSLANNLYLMDGKGLEIGGPSPLQQIRDILYRNAERMDNVNFSLQNTWSGMHGPFVYDTEYENEATELKDIESETYDFVVASHTLEHIANPLKALFEFKRVLKPNGYMVLVLPLKETCFDHARDYTRFDTILDKFDKNVDENDLSSLREILCKHDLEMDKHAGNFVQFVERSLRNHENRCLHHHVFDETLLRQCVEFIGCESVYFDRSDNYNLWCILKKNEKN
jgi:SAM-dependent methyltransferase